jgi:hypothetical protein
VRVVIVDDDELTSTPEGEDIDESQPSLSQKLVHTGKITQLVCPLRETVFADEDASQLANSVNRAITGRADIAFVAAPAPTPPAVGTRRRPAERD